MECPLVSIITPSYNCGSYIRYTIESVLNQSYSNLELIIIDGGSSDDTVNILKEYNELIWISEQDQGQSNAINKGFKKARGEIIGWLNSDDTYQPGAIEAAVKYFINNPNIDLLYTDVNIINEKGEIIGLSRGDDFNLQGLLTFNMVKQPSLFMRRKVIDHLSGLNEDLHYVMDQEFWLRAGISNFNFCYLKHAVFANFRLIPGTKSFESGPLFTYEWVQVIKANLDNPCFDYIVESKKKKILNNSYSSIYLSRMVEAMGEKKRSRVLRYFFFSIKLNPFLIKNLGIYKLLLYGLLGLKIDRFRKFQ